MAEIAIPLGKEARLYYAIPNGAVTCAAAAAALEAAGYEVQGIVDATILLDKEDTDTSRRITHGWKDSRAADKGITLTFDIFNAHDSGVEQAAIDVLRKTFMNDTYDGDNAVSGITLYAKSSKSAAVPSEPGPQAVDGEGICADFFITKFERAEPHRDGQKYNVEAKVTCVHGRYPAWV